MTTEAGSASRARSPAKVVNRAVGTLALIPQRVRERRFWIIQALVCAAVSSHYIVEFTGVTEPFETLHGISITLYIVPMLYASLAYGWEGAVLTALWGALLTTPSMFVWHRSELHWLTEVTQLLVTLPVGMLVAWRVDRETKLRVDAEATSASLELVNNVGSELRKALDVEQELPAVVSAITAHLRFDASWIVLIEESGPDRKIISLSDSTVGAAELEMRSAALHRRVAEQGEDSAQDDAYLAVPLRGESGLLGSLGCHVRPLEAMDGQQLELLRTLASQVAISLEKTRLYRERQRNLSRYAQGVTQAQEDERLRIARELHDDTAQELVHLVRNIERMPQCGPNEIEREAETIAELARDILKSVRRYARNLRPSVLDDLGLVAGIEMIVSETDEQTKTSVTLAVFGDERRCEPSVELALFRIAQEALRNVEKHANATAAQVSLTFNDEKITLEVQDDGVGFELPAELHESVQDGQLGLLGMAERAELVGGTFEVTSSLDGSGTLVRVVA